ncbi:hypothetical protein Hanom_Chr05g00455481 [Helianthus anomalus]
MAVPGGYGRFLQLVVTSTFCCPPSPLHHSTAQGNFTISLQKSFGFRRFPSSPPRSRLSPSQPPQVTHYKSSPTQHHQGLSLSYFASVIKRVSLFLWIPIHTRLSMPYIQNQPSLISYGFSPTAIEEEFVNNIITKHISGSS